MSATTLPTTFPATVAHDHGGRTYVIVPDEIAREMRKLIKANFKDYVGIAYGESEDFPRDHWISQVSRFILAAVARHGYDDWDRARAARGDFSGFIVGESGWDMENHWWKDYENTQDLHVPGFIHTRYNGSGDIVFTA